MSVEAQTKSQEPVVKAVLRHYEPRDRAVVREICCVTAFRNLGAQAIFAHAEDRELFADYWSRYYTDFEPESAWVAEREGRVIGYLFGCVDASRHVRTMGWRIVPGVLVRLLWRLMLGKYRQGRSRLFVKWLFLKSWREAPAVPMKKYPAHFHCNLLPGGYNQHLYTSLALGFMDHLADRGVTHLHGHVLEMKRKGIWHRILNSFSKHCPGWLEVSTEKSSDLGQDVLGLPAGEMVNRAYAMTVANYRQFLLWAAREYRL